MAERTDPRISRTNQAFEQAIVELASARAVSQITVAELAERAGTTRATFYNRYSTPLDLLVTVLAADLEHGKDLDDQRRAHGGYSAEELLRRATGEVVEHVERFRPVYQHALDDAADRGIYHALVRHFADYSLAFLSRCTHPDLPKANHQLVAQFVANGFAGAIEAWLRDATLTKDDLVDAAVACVPVWWS